MVPPLERATSPNLILEKAERGYRRRSALSMSAHDRIALSEPASIPVDKGSHVVPAEAPQKVVGVLDVPGGTVAVQHDETAGNLSGSGAELRERDRAGAGKMALPKAGGVAEVNEMNRGARSTLEQGLELDRRKPSKRHGRLSVPSLGGRDAAHDVDQAQDTIS